MCLDFPAQVVDLHGNQAIVETDGRHRRASTLLLPDAAVGDWVYVSAGHIIDRISAAEAALVSQELRQAIGDAT
jgi:hydrogenase assembly chaperone HypC/HupF